MKIVVLKGGASSEREVSLNSGTNIANALKENGHDVLCLDTVLPIEQIKSPMKPTQKMIRNGDRNLATLLSAPEVQSAKFIFNALHGGSGENGAIQAILQTMGLKFNGSGVEGCAITMDKIVSKVIFEKHGIPTPEWLCFRNDENRQNAEIIETILAKFQPPLVVKPAHEGSTVGLTIVRDVKSLDSALKVARKFNGSILVEKFIEGRELTVAILGDKALPIVEICPKHGIYDYECKYMHGMSEYRMPAEVEPMLTRLIQDWTVVAFKALNCSGYGRMDLRLSLDHKPYFLEMNSLPGMTSTSLVPKAAKTVGISFNELLEKIIKLGLNR
ncbi:MAG: D-alanine--D-alanine ligase [Candidatus Marinimicrobia bacterium]|nr:D-alanine--D-alanine ligase [Candidatus Neomarinimicrobiota bacterium]